MAKMPKVGATVALDGEKEFRQALSEINAGLKVNASQMQLVTATYQDGGKSVRDLTAAQEVLETQIASQTEKVRLMERALQNSAEKNGESSKKTMEWQASLNKAKAELARMETALKDNQSAVEKAGSETEKFSDELKKVENAGETAKRGSDIFNHSLGDLISDGIQKAISAISDLMEKTAEYRADMSKLEQNSRDAGTSMLVVQDGMRRLNAITRETDSNIEAISNLLAAGFTDNNLVAAIDTLSGAVIKFPDTIKIESLADSLQETIATKEATGQFAELLERVGINVEWYNNRISKMSDAQARNFSISVLQKKGIADTTKEWRENNEQIINAANAQYNLNDTMSRFAEKIEPSVSKATETLNDILIENEEEIDKIIDFGVMLADDVLPDIVDLVGDVADVLGPVLDLVSELNEMSSTVSPFVQKLMGLGNLGGSIGDFVSSATNGRKTEPLTTASVPRYARGTSYHPGGLATINDGGGYPGETVLLPRGTKVFPADQRGSGDTYYVTIDAKSIQEFNDIARIAKNQRQSQRMGYIGGA